MDSTPFGTWFLNADYCGGTNKNSFLFTATIPGDPMINQFIDEMITGNGTSEILDNLNWDAGTGLLEFRRVEDGFWEWYSGMVVEGVFVGRFSHSQQWDGKPDLTQFLSHVTGWNSTFLDQDIVPRSYDLTIQQDHQARLRIDRQNEGQFVGRLKVYAVGDENENEEPEYDLEVTRWDGHDLRFIKHYPDGTPEVYIGTAIGRGISGISAGKHHSGPWSGVRSGVLSYGLVTKTAEEQTLWQRRTREVLLHLMMPSNTVPLTSTVDQVPGKGKVSDDRQGTHRDDASQHHPPNYRVSELHFHFTLENPYGDLPMERESHGFLAVPNIPAPPEGYRVVLTVNGHHGSAQDMMHPVPGSGDIY